MSDLSDLDRLYAAVEALRVEVHGYRADLNGRLRALEVKDAKRAGAEAARSMSRGQLVGSVMVIAAVVGAASAVASQVLNNL